MLREQIQFTFQRDFNACINNGPSYTRPVHLTAYEQSAREISFEKSEKKINNFSNYSPSLVLSWYTDTHRNVDSWVWNPAQRQYYVIIGKMNTLVLEDLYFSPIQAAPFHFWNLNWNDITCDYWIIYRKHIEFVSIKLDLTTTSHRFSTLIYIFIYI